MATESPRRPHLGSWSMLQPLQTWFREVDETRHFQLRTVLVGFRKDERIQCVPLAEPKHRLCKRQQVVWCRIW